MKENYVSQYGCYNTVQSRKQKPYRGNEVCEPTRKIYSTVTRTATKQYGTQCHYQQQPYSSPQSNLLNIHKKQPVTYAQSNEPEEINNPVLVGYWFEWPPRIDLATIPGYNIINVAFMQNGPDGIPTFKPMYMTDEQFIAVVDMLKCEGREVLISLGGAGNLVSLTQNDKQAFIDETIRIVDKYGFSGIDIDLEDVSITAADNQTVIPEALIEVKNHYLRQGKKFMITLAPEFPFLRGVDALYRPYIEKLEGYYDLIYPQYYNQGPDGIWSYELNMWLRSDSNEHKAEFLYTLTTAIVTGTQDYMRIPADKLAIGLPASPSAAFNGYVENPDDVKSAFNRLDADGNCIRGLMTWSINHDAINCYQFVSYYAPLVFSRCGACGTPPIILPPAPVLCPPENLRAVSIAYSSIGIEWDACTDGQEIIGHIICRDDMEIARVQSNQTSFLDTGLSPNTEYTYTVKAFDSNGNHSAPSNELLVTTGSQQICNGIGRF